MWRKQRQSIKRFSYELKNVCLFTLRNAQFSFKWCEKSIVDFDRSSERPNGMLSYECFVFRRAHKLRPSLNRPIFGKFGICPKTNDKIPLDVSISQNVCPKTLLINSNYQWDEFGNAIQLLLINFQLMRVSIHDQWMICMVDVNVFSHQIP